MSSPNPSSSPFLINADCMREISRYCSYTNFSLCLGSLEEDYGLQKCIGMMFKRAFLAKKSLSVSREIFNTPSEMWSEYTEQLFTNAGYKVHTFEDLIVIEW